MWLILGFGPEMGQIQAQFALANPKFVGLQ